MVNISKIGDSTIKFTFTDNDRYLYNGEITLPLNSLILEFDTSDLVIFKKIDGDVFVTFLLENSNFDSKDSLIEFYKTSMVGSTGGGGDITSGEVQTMIDESVSGKADSSAVTEEISAAVSGKADTSYVDSAVSGKVDTTTYSTYTAATDSRIAEDEEVTAAALVNLNEALSGKLDTSAYTPTDLSQYWTSAETQSAITQATSGKADSNAVYLKSETSGATEIATALSGKQDTLSAGTNITIVDNVISAEGGGKAIEAGRGISVTTGETADTVSFNLPISAGTGVYSVAEGVETMANGRYSHAEGYGSQTNVDYSHAEGINTVANGQAAHAEGGYTRANKPYSYAGGYVVNANNHYEHSQGYFNISSSASTTFGNSGNTLMSVGNGYNGSSQVKHNAFEIRQNGDIYIADTNDMSTSNYYEKPMIKLQDALGGGGSSYSAGTGIDITNDVISVTGMVEASAVTSAVTSGSTNVLTSGGAYEQFGGLKLVKLTESEYAALVSKDANTLYVVIPDPSNP